VVYAAQVFGHDFPAPGIGVIALIFVVGFFVVSRSAGEAGVDLGGNGPRRRGSGRMHQCRRCGRNFQPEQVELLDNGEVRKWIDDRCPGCGWDVDWGNPDNKPGGASGRW
jgi:hypothetical protein